MPDKIVENIYKIATHHFHRWYGLVSAIFLIGFFSLSIYRLIPQGEVVFREYIRWILSIGFIICIRWGFYVWYYPKRSNKRLGVAIAVQVEDLEDYKLFKTDFLAPFKSKISDLDLPFDVLVLKNHQSEKVETVADARTILRKTKAHFCIWGSIKKRGNVSGGEKYIFSLKGIVIHKPIIEVQKIVLRKEFETLLVDTPAFEKSLQFENFTFRANQAVIALDYITGRAALLSGDFNIAIRMHEPLFQEIQRGQPFPITKEVIRNLLSFEYEQKATSEIFNPSTPSAYEESVQKALQYNPNNYGALLKKGVLEFDNGNGDVRAALETINKARSHADGGYEWMYSKAFLHFWLGEFGAAMHCCEKLKKKNYKGEEVTVREVMEFTEKLLEINTKPQLYYWLAFVSIEKGRNSSFADTHFQSFIEKADDSMKKLKDEAIKYLAEIRKEIGY